MTLYPMSAAAGDDPARAGPGAVVYGAAEAHERCGGGGGGIEEGKMLFCLNPNVVFRSD